MDCFKNNMLFEIIKIIINTLTQLPLKNGEMLVRDREYSGKYCQSVVEVQVEGHLGTQGKWWKEGSLKYTHHKFTV